MTAPPNAQLTHVGLYVGDMDVMVAFYKDLIGFVVTDSGEFLGRRLTFLSRRADEHHQLLSQVSFRVDDLDALKHFHQRALELGASGMEGRNHGNSWSIYFQDPEGNRIEMYTPTPWYVSQPWRVSLDLSETNDEIEARTRSLIAESATWGPLETWQAQLADRLEEAAP
jgi:catechol-2,3-dioxygenase